MLEEVSDLRFQQLWHIVNRYNENVFFAQANDYITNGNYVVTWAFNYTPAVEDWRAGVVDALSKYVTGGSWDDVKTAFVDGWAAQYAAEHAA